MKCFVSRHIIDLNYPIRFMYREIPDNDIDSGWRFLSGFEDEVYINNADNIFLYEIEAIMRIDSSVTSLLHHRDGVMFEKLAHKECFSKINWAQQAVPLQNNG